jgi:hypothetical protein
MLSDEEARELLSVHAYIHEYSPTCNKKHLVRMIAAGQGVLDRRYYGDGRFCKRETKDICGFGNTFGEAAAEALYLKKVSEMEFRREHGLKAA